MTVCENAGSCGGCYYQGIPYEEQLAIKEKEVRELLRPVISGDYLFEPIIPSPEESRYRNKMEFSFGDREKGGALTLGLHQKRSFFNILNTDDCRLPHEDFGLLLKESREYFSDKGITYFHKKTHEGYLRHLLIRRAVKTGEILLALVTADFFSEGSQEEQRSAEKELLSGWTTRILSMEESGGLKGKLAGILHIRNNSIADAIKDEGTELLYGKDYFYEELLGLKFRITAFSFFQTNSLGAERLYNKVRDYAGYRELQEAQQEDAGHAARPVIYDLYSGTGTITQLMSSVAEKAIGVELVPEAVRAARENAALNGIGNCSFIAGDVLKVLQEGGELLREDGTPEHAPRPDLIILDPPRDGIHQKALKKILDYGVETLIYVSCKPKSLARDLVPIQAAGYQVRKVCPVDMFPQTNNVETVCLLVRRNGLHIDIDVDVEEMLQEKCGQATYAQIRDYVLEQNGLKVSSLYISQVKRKCGLDVSDSYNKSKSEDTAVPQCPPEREEAIMNALRHFGVI